MVSYGTRREGNKRFLSTYDTIHLAWCTPSVGGAHSLWPVDWFHSTLHGSFMKALSFHGDYSYGSFMATYIHAFGKASFHDIHKYLRATLDEGPRSWDQWIRAILLVESFKLVLRPFDIEGPKPKSGKLGEAKPTCRWSPLWLYITNLVSFIVLTISISLDSKWNLMLFRIPIPFLPIFLASVHLARNFIGFTYTST